MKHAIGIMFCLILAIPSAAIVFIGAFSMWRNGFDLATTGVCICAAAMCRYCILIISDLFKDSDF